MEYPALMEWLFKGTVTVLLTVGGWLCIMLFKTVQKTREDLTDHKMHVSENYAKKTDVIASIGQLNETVKRVHERIDGIFNLLNSDRTH